MAEALSQRAPPHINFLFILARTAYEYYRTERTAAAIKLREGDGTKAGRKFVNAIYNRKGQPICDKPSALRAGK